MRNEFNSNLLHWAALVNSRSCARVLLRFAPHLLEAVDDDNETPLVHAVGHNSVGGAEMLLGEGADVRAEDKFGCTVFDIARSNYNEVMLDMLYKVSRIFLFF